MKFLFVLMAALATSAAGDRRKRQSMYDYGLSDQLNRLGSYQYQGQLGTTGQYGSQYGTSQYGSQYPYNQYGSTGQYGNTGYNQYGASNTYRDSTMMSPYGSTYSTTGSQYPSTTQYDQYGKPVTQYSALSTWGNTAGSAD